MITPLDIENKKYLYQTFCATLLKEPMQKVFSFAENKI